MILLVAAFAATLVSAVPDRAPGGRPGRDGTRSVEAHQTASTVLRHIYAVHVALRGCDEAARQHGKPQFMPGVGIEEARRAMRNVDEVAREAGIDVDRIWAEVAPVATVTAEALKADTPENLDNCARIGSVFRIDLSNLQNALRALGATRSLIEKDF